MDGSGLVAVVLVDKGLACSPGEEGADDVSVVDVRSELHCMDKRLM